MPTYQYACTACDHRFEAVQSFSDASLTECPACSGLLRKVFSSVGIVFKGSGFYRTDSRSAAGSTVPGGSESSSGGSDKGGSDKGGSGSTEKSTSTSSEKSASTSSSSTTSSAPAAAAKS
ncbi:MAG: FmdB family transcriptional regulator [Pseudonocardiales bacterium]|nr:FmdB family transcriptional regulator [Pseudonocardiales bacterium]